MHTINLIGRKIYIKASLVKGCARVHLPQLKSFTNEIGLVHSEITSIQCGDGQMWLKEKTLWHLHPFIQHCAGCASWPPSNLEAGWVSLKLSAGQQGGKQHSSPHCTLTSCTGRTFQLLSCKPSFWLAHPYTRHFICFQWFLTQERTQGCA